MHEQWRPDLCHQEYTSWCPLEYCIVKVSQEETIYVFWKKNNNNNVDSQYGLLCYGNTWKTDSAKKLKLQKLLLLHVQT